MGDTGYVLEATYVVLIESIILLTAFLGFIALVAQQLYMPTLPTAMVFLFATAVLMTIAAIIFIHAGFHGADDKQILRFQFRANAFTLGILQATIHVLTASCGVFFGLSAFYWVADNEHLMLAALFSSRILLFKLNVSIQTYMLVATGFVTTIYLLSVILFVTLRNCLGDLITCRIHVFGFCETVVILTFWVQYYREVLIEQLCPGQTLCAPEDISLYETQDLSTMQLVLIYCAAMLMLEMITAKIYTLFITGQQIIFFLVYLLLRLIAVSSVVVGYFMFIEHESAGLKYLNWAMAAALCLCLGVEIVFVLLRDKAREDTPERKKEPPTQNSTQFSSRRKPFLDWSDAIALGSKQSIRRPFLRKNLKNDRQKKE